MRFVLVLLACGVLAGCATVSKEECVAGDWTAIGLRDGAAGRVGDTQFTRHQDACAKVQVTPNRTEWARGYAQGLAQYCTPASGVTEGLSGRLYRGVCPVATRAGFQQGYNLGRNVYDQRQVIAEINNEISNLRSRSHQIGGATDPTLVTERLMNDSDILQLSLMRLSEQARLAQMERAVAAFRAGL